MVGRGRVFSIFGELHHDPPTPDLDLTLGATCPEADPCFSHCFFPCFPVRCGFLHEDVLPRGLRQPDFPTSVAFKQLVSHWSHYLQGDPATFAPSIASQTLRCSAANWRFQGLENHGSCRVSRLSFRPAPQGETFACLWRSICDSIPAGLRRSWYSSQWRRNSMTNKDRKYLKITLTTARGPP